MNACACGAAPSPATANAAASGSASSLRRNMLEPLLSVGFVAPTLRPASDRENRDATLNLVQGRGPNPLTRHLPTVRLPSVRAAEEAHLLRRRAVGVAHEGREVRHLLGVEGPGLRG